MKLSRRNLLQNTAAYGSAAAIFTPFLRSVAAHAAGDASAMPKRFVFIVKASGIDNANLLPAGLAKEYVGKREKLIDVSFADHALPEILKPLEAFKDKIKELVLYSVSEEYFAVRQHLGLTIG